MKREIKGIYLIERVCSLPENEKRKYYVGQSINIFDRLNQHCTEGKSGIDRSISELGADKFSFKILEKVEKAKDLDDCEKKWIEHYRKLHGDEQLYNISQTANARRNGIDAETRENIKKLFIEDLGRSIYAIAEYFDISYKDVIKIRKPLLEKKGLIWKKCKFITAKTGEDAENWRGGVLTQKQVKIVNEILAEPGKTKKDIPSSLISESDLNVYLEFKKSGKEYNCAPPIEGAELVE